MKITPTRRGFLEAAGFAGLGAVGITTSQAAIEPTPWGLKLGIATYTFRKFDRAKTIEFIKAVGAPWLSIKDYHLLQTDTPEQLRAAHKEFEDAGLKITSGGNVDMTK